MSTKEIQQKITNLIIEKLNQGVIPWQKPWNALSGAPRNLVSKKPYRGINSLILAMQGFQSPYWVTFNQVKALGGKVRKGEKSTPVVFYSIIEKEDKETGEKKKIFFLRYYNVFNAEQTEGLESKIPSAPAPREFNPIEEAENLVAGYVDKPLIQHKGNRACYVPALDIVTMPEKGAFKGEEEYYSTLFHELVHSTGHGARLSREGVTNFDKFGSEQYAKEELVAEFGASFLCAHAGIERTLENSVAYIAGWKRRIADDITLVIGAASQAQKAVDYMMGVVNHTEKEESEDLATA